MRRYFVIALLNRLHMVTKYLQKDREQNLMKITNRIYYSFQWVIHAFYLFRSIKRYMVLYFYLFYLFNLEPMKKKHMTEEEIALKKSEIARRRKHQSIQRAEQDKVNLYFENIGNSFSRK